MTNCGILQVSWHMQWQTCKFCLIILQFHNTYPVNPVLHSVYCLVHSVCCLVHSVCCLVHSVCCLVHSVCCSIHSVCCSIHSVCCSIHSVCYLTLSVCCSIHSVCCLTLSVCCSASLASVVAALGFQSTWHQELQTWLRWDQWRCWQ